MSLSSHSYPFSSPSTAFFYPDLLASRLVDTRRSALWLPTSSLDFDSCLISSTSWLASAGSVDSVDSVASVASVSPSTAGADVDLVT